MRQVEQDVVEGETYSFDFLDTDVAAEIFAEIGKMGLPTIMGAVKELLAGLGDEGIADMQVQDFLKMASQKMNLGALGVAVAAAIEPKAVSRIIKTLCSCVTATGPFGKLSDPVMFNQHFKGRAGDALLVAIRSFKQNGGGHFFVSAAKLAGVFKKADSTPAPQA